MRDRNVSLGFASAAFVWFIGATLVIVGVVLPEEPMGSDLGHLGIVACCGGAVLMIRSMMCRATAQLENLFFVGRDFGRAEAESVPLQRQATRPLRVP